LNSHCYWLLRKEGKAADEANAVLEGQSVAFKNEFLFQHGINYNDLPSWQKRGTGLYWEDYEKVGFNPITNKEEIATRRRLKTDMELPLREEYASFIEGILSDK
jgi:tRNA(His) 5'-end guanylyltransferase